MKEVYNSMVKSQITELQFFSLLVCILDFKYVEQLLQNQQYLEFYIGMLVPYTKFHVK